MLLVDGIFHSFHRNYAGKILAVRRVIAHSLRGHNRKITLLHRINETLLGEKLEIGSLRCAHIAVSLIAVPCEVYEFGSVVGAWDRCSDDRAGCKKVLGPTSSEEGSAAGQQILLNEPSRMKK